MPHVTGVIASAEADGDVATIVVYPLIGTSSRRIDPSASIVLILRRQEWQLEGAVLEYVEHVIGRSGDIMFIEEEGGVLVFDGFYTN